MAFVVLSVWVLLWWMAEMIGLKNEQKEALAKDYASMMNMKAWNDLVKWANSERDASIIKQDSKSASDLNINTVCEDRGLRKGLMRVIQHAEQCREGV